MKGLCVQVHNLYTRVCFAAWLSLQFHCNRGKVFREISSSILNNVDENVFEFINDLKHI